MKKGLLKYTNMFLKKFGVKVVGSASDTFRMASGLQRIAQHGIELESIIDIGASDGKWSIDAMQIFPEVQCLAIEPLKEREPALITLKDKTDNFEYELCVVGEHDDEKVALNVADDLDGSTVDGGGGVQRLVQQKTIDNIVSRKKLSGPFLLKFDTHGYELPILAGAKKTLRKTNVIIMEVYNFRLTQTTLRYHEMCDHMESLGFRCFDIVDPMLRKYDKAFWQMDIFFCRKDNDLFNHNAYS